MGEDHPTEDHPTIVVEGQQPPVTGEACRGRRTRSRWRWAALACIAVVAAGGLLPLAVYWQERTLREARHELLEGNPQRALGLVDYFLDSHPDDGAALALKARALSVTGQAQAAVNLYERIGGAATVEDLHAWAQSYLMLQSWSRALALLTQVLHLDPDNADALHEITACCIRLGLLQEAAESARRLSQVPGQKARGFVFLAAILNDLGNGGQSIETYQQVAGLTPDGKGLQIPPDEFFTQYSLVLISQGKGAAAVPWLQKSLASRPTAAAYYYLGNAQAQAGNGKAAETAWKRSLDLDPGGVPVREALATQALEKGDIDVAMKWLHPLERLAETRFKTAYLFQRIAMKRKDQAATQRWAKTLDKLQKQDQLRKRVERLMLESPHSFWANVARARRFAAEGNWQQAGDMMRELAPQSPKDPFVQDLASAIRKRGPLPSLERIPIKGD